MTELASNDVTASDRASTQRSGFVIQLARSDQDLFDSLRLRYGVFAKEMRARLPRTDAAIEYDRFDRYCDHILVREAITGLAVGCYRMMTPERAREAGGFYSETEFDLAGINKLRTRIVELGRACVHPAYRNGVVISLLWCGILKYVVRTGHDYVIGCASIPADGDRRGAAALCARLQREAAGPPEFRVHPKRPFRIEGDAGGESDAKLPPLVKGYLRLGAFACGDPAWDPEFGTADILMMLPLSRMDPRYMLRLSRWA